MIPNFRRLVYYALRVLVAAACCYGIWRSLTLARADFLFRQNTEESLHAAIRLVPDDWEYYMRLALFEDAHARELLNTALRLNRYDAQADIELGLQYEAEGDFGHAERQLLEAYNVDHTYLPRWSLANYYFRRDNMPAFWAWARSSAEMPSDDVGPLFELCWRASPDPEKITRTILNDNPELVRQYIGFLLEKDQTGAVSGIAQRLVGTGDAKSDIPLLFAVVNSLVTSNDAAAADALWRRLIERGWIVADATVPNNANFLREPLPVSFDWSLPEYSGLHSWPGPSGLETEFTGSEPEDCTVAEQAVVLAPGDYTLSYSYRTSYIPPGAGVRWQVVDARSKAVLAESSDLSSEATKRAALGFSVPQGESLVRLRLGYRRALGTTRIAGTLVVLSTQIEAVPKS
jgi:tetratricopeptide (TPR) repeat protein